MSEHGQVIRLTEILPVKAIQREASKRDRTSADRRGDARNGEINRYIRYWTQNPGAKIRGPVGPIHYKGRTEDRKALGC